MKRLLLNIIILFSLLSPLSTTNAFSEEITPLSNQEYFTAVHRSFAEAKDSIYVVMYYINFKKYQPKSTVSILVNDLVKAKERGVDVKVVLDQTIVFKGNRLLGRDYEKTEKNRRAFDYLKANGIDVSFDKLEIYTHGKCILIDGEIVIIGSHNWTKNALTRSNEYSVLFKSKDVASDFLDDFKKIQIDHEASAKVSQKYIIFNTDIMLTVLSDFVSHSNDYCWNVYMYLVGHYNPGKEIDFDYKKVADYIGISDRMSKNKYREMLGYQTLRNLQNKYGLLKYAPVRGKNAKVILKPFNDTKKKYFEIPEKFWGTGWDMRLSLSGRYCYFINLIEGGPEHKMWMMSKKALVEKYKVGKEVISNGMAELRHWNLLEIEYGNIDSGKGYNNRLPNRYRLKNLYSIENFSKELGKLYDKYGKNKVKEAQEYARLVFCENNLVDIEDIINMVDEYGIDKVNFAFDKIKDRSKDNPKRSIAYVKGILQSMAMKTNK